MPVTRALRLATLAVVGLLPGILKRAWYRWGFGYRIGRDVKIGLVLLDCRSLTIEDRARIGHGTAFVSCGDVRIGASSEVGALNLFRGGSRIDLGPFTQVIRMNVVNAIVGHDCHGAPDSSFIMEFGAVVTSEHRIDFTDCVRLGRCAMLAGRGSTIWTHNRRRNRRVDVGHFSYVGSETKFAPGATVPDCSIVALGSVLMAPFPDPGILIAGAPARAVRPLGAQDAETVFGETRRDLPPQDYPWEVLGLDGPPPDWPARPAFEQKGV